MYRKFSSQIASLQKVANFNKNSKNIENVSSKKLFRLIEQSDASNVPKETFYLNVENFIKKKIETKNINGKHNLEDSIYLILTVDRLSKNMNISSNITEHYINDISSYPENYGINSISIFLKFLKRMSIKNIKIINSLNILLKLGIDEPIDTRTALQLFSGISYQLQNQAHLEEFDFLIDYCETACSSLIDGFNLSETCMFLKTCAELNISNHETVSKLLIRCSSQVPNMDEWTISQILFYSSKLRIKNSIFYENAFNKLANMEELEKWSNQNISSVLYAAQRLHQWNVGFFEAAVQTLIQDVLPLREDNISNQRLTGPCQDSISNQRLIGPCLLRLHTMSIHELCRVTDAVGSFMAATNEMSRSSKLSKNIYKIQLNRCFSSEWSKFLRILGITISRRLLLSNIEDEKWALQTCAKILKGFAESGFRSEALLFQVTKSLERILPHSIPSNQDIEHILYSFSYFNWPSPIIENLLLTVSDSKNVFNIQKNVLLIHAANKLSCCKSFFKNLVSCTFLQLNGYMKPMKQINSTFDLKIESLNDSKLSNLLKCVKFSKKTTTDTSVNIFTNIVSLPNFVNPDLLTVLVTSLSMKPLGVCREHREMVIQLLSVLPGMCSLASNKSDLTDKINEKTILPSNGYFWENSNNKSETVNLSDVVLDDNLDGFFNDEIDFKMKSTYYCQIEVCLRIIFLSTVLSDKYMSIKDIFEYGRVAFWFFDMIPPPVRQTSSCSNLHREVLSTVNQFTTSREEECGGPYSIDIVINNYV
eukprot:GHVL01029358.1.p1 GENE.GHVL01029358.1~~GHVL01029358.1.p1  ORF type:complete len:764 (-),score=160.56 GHVL01029358.1:268-2559(-)